MLGITPTAIGKDDAFQSRPFAELLPDVDLQAVPTIGDPYDPNLEALAAQRPDLIIGDEFHGELYEKLSAIAPTFLVTYINSGGWRERFPAIADAVGRADRVETIDAAYREEIKKIPGALAGVKVAFVRSASDGAFRLDSLPSAFAGSVAEDAGVSTLCPEGVGESDEGSGFLELSAEQLEVLEGADVLILGTTPSTTRTLRTPCLNWRAIPCGPPCRRPGGSGSRPYLQRRNLLPRHPAPASPGRAGRQPLSHLDKERKMSVTPLDRPAPDVLEDLTHRESIADLINRSVSQQVIAGLTRRDFVKGGLAAGLLLGSGCNPRTGSTPEAPAGGFPVTIEHIDGSTTISSRPQRVVTVGLIEQDALLALGVVPVGATEWLDERPGAIHPWATGALGDAALPEVMSSEAIQFEQIAGLKPDLIVAIYNVTVETADYEKLSKIAPTVLAPPDVDLTSVTWQELTRIIGKAVGRQEQAEELVAQVEAKFAGTRASNPNFSGSAVNVYPTPDGAFQAYPPPDLGGQFLSALGFETPPRILELAAGKSFVDLSPEQLELLDADVIVWLLDNAAGEERLKANPLYQRMRAVTEGRAIYLNYEDKNPPIAAATSFQTVLSLPFLIDALTPRLAAALDGDPATDVT